MVTLAARAAAFVVAIVAGFASYRHIVDVALGAGEHRPVALVLPLAIDGLIVVATMAFVEDKRARRRPRSSARFALGFGVAATLAANIASAQPGWTARAVAAVPAVSFLIAVEVLSRSGRRIAEPVPSVDVSRIPAEAGHLEPEPVVDPWQFAVPVDHEPVREPVRRRPVPQGLTAAQRVTAAHAREPEAAHARIAQLAGVSVASVKRHRPTGSQTGSRNYQPPAQTPVNGHVPDLKGITK